MKGQILVEMLLYIMQYIVDHFHGHNKIINIYLTKIAYHEQSIG